EAPGGTGDDHNLFGDVHDLTLSIIALARNAWDSRFLVHSSHEPRMIRSWTRSPTSLISVAFAARCWGACAPKRRGAWRCRAAAVRASTRSPPAPLGCGSATRLRSS